MLTDASQDAENTSRANRVMWPILLPKSGDYPHPREMSTHRDHKQQTPLTAVSVKNQVPGHSLLGGNASWGPEASVTPRLGAGEEFPLGS